MAACYHKNDFDTDVKRFLTFITSISSFFENKDFVEYFYNKNIYIKYTTWTGSLERRITFYTVYKEKSVHLFRIDYNVSNEVCTIFSSFDNSKDLIAALNFFNDEINSFLVSIDKRILEQRQQEQDFESEAIEAFKIINILDKS
jgi:hypothetical protein